MSLVVSIIVPALNERVSIEPTLTELQAVRRAGHEVILVDGGSEDGTREASSSLVDRVLLSRRGRALQMNAGAREARGDVLVFLHADTRIPPDSMAALLERLPSSDRSWGRFDVKLSGQRVSLRLVARMMNLRSRWTGIATGDQAIFVRRHTFEALGGYAEIPLMEDIAISRALRRVCAPLCIRPPIVTSSRRWEQNGVWRTIFLMWRLRLAYFFGADPQRLAELYYC